MDRPSGVKVLLILLKFDLDFSPTLAVLNFDK